MPQSRPPATLLPWDTEFFGVRIARLHGSRLSPELALQASHWCQQHEIGCLYFLADPVYETTRQARLNAFELVDVRVTLELAVGSATRASLEPGNYRLCRRDDIDTLRQLASRSYHTRFHADPRFPDELCNELYALWIERSCDDYADAVIVVPKDDKPAGFITCKTVTADTGDPHHGQIGLIGVSPDMRGRGIGEQLLAFAVDWFAQQGVTTVSVVTQGDNIPAQRLYQKMGFRTQSLQLWYHRWFGEEQPGQARYRTRLPGTHSS